MSEGDPETRAAREVMDRAIRRLGVLELLFLGVAAAGALAAGALTAWLLREAAGLGFRPTWWVSSLLYFLVPGGIVYARARRETRGRRTEPEGSDHDEERNERHG